MEHRQVIADRFEVELRAASGGMGSVYRARDRLTGEIVAVKVLHSEIMQDVARFMREGRVMAQLNHPNIVRHVAHGVTSDGTPYLAMEWLEGQDLARRLVKGPLGVRSSVDLALRTAGALATAHTRGMVHRDLKPSNLFLVGGDIERVKIIDFGLAMVKDPTQLLTRTGMSFGTPAYMAPEQIRAFGSVDARSDVFALGCILYECLSGRAAYTAEDMAALLGGLPPQIMREIPDVPEALVSYAMRMMSPDRANRPSDASVVAAEILDLGIEGHDSTPPRWAGEVAPGDSELLGLVLVEAPAPEVDRATPKQAHAPSPGAERFPAPSGETMRVELHGTSAGQAAIRKVAALLGAQAKPFAGGRIAITFGPAEAAVDMAALAGQAALAVRGLFPQAKMAVAIGRGLSPPDGVLGEIVDRCSEVLAGLSAGIAVDAVTADLLDPRFRLARDGHGPARLVDERPDWESPHPVLGKVAPLVGRDGELAALEGLIDGWTDDPKAKVVLILGPTGVGKSRLGHELVARMRKREPPIELVVGRGAPGEASRPFDLVGSIVRCAAGVRGGDSPTMAEGKLKARVARCVPAAHLPRVTELLGEMAGLPSGREDSPVVRQARGDRPLMTDLLRRAFEEWLWAETEGASLALVLEDLQGADSSSLGMLEEALRNLTDRPLLVIAMARPAVYERYPELWKRRPVELVRLAELPRKVSERLALELLGGRQVAADRLARALDLSGGNPFLLERLLERLPSGTGDEIPPAACATVEVQLARLPARARRVLRAASVLGPVFGKGRLSAALGEEMSPAQIDEWLALLESQGLVQAGGQPDVPGEVAYKFGRVLVREVVSGLLAPAERKELEERAQK